MIEYIIAYLVAGVMLALLLGLQMREESVRGAALITGTVVAFWPALLLLYVAEKRRMNYEQR